MLTLSEEKVQISKHLTIKLGKLKIRVLTRNGSHLLNY